MLEQQKDAETAKGFFSKRSAKGKANSEMNKFKAGVLALEQVKFCYKNI